MRKVTKDNPLCWIANPELWLEFCDLTGRQPYNSDVWTLRDVETLVTFLRKQKHRLKTTVKV